MKYLLFLLLSAVNITAIAQVNKKITLQYYGFSDATDSTKSFTVADFPKLNKADLYKKTLTYVNSLYKNPHLVVTAVEGESITVNGSTQSIKGDLAWYEYPFNYNIVFKFKDGKLRYEPKFVSLEEVWSKTSPPRKHYIASTDSPKPGEINCIYIKKNDSDEYFLFKADLKKSLEGWANGYLADLSKALSEEW